MIGLQLYTLRAFLKTPEDIRATMKKVKAIGYNVVQVSGTGPIEPKDLRKIMDDEGLISNSVHTNYDKLVNETEKVIEECKIMGYTTLACPHLGNEHRTEDGYKKVASNLTKAGEKFYNNGIILTYHNHQFELERFNGKTGLDIIYGESDPHYLQTEFDTYWLQFGGSDPAEWITRFKDRTPIVHLKDLGINKEWKQTMVPIGEGNINWKRVFAALKEAKTKYYYVEQDDCNGLDPFECIKISLNNLKKMGIE